MDFEQELKKFELSSVFTINFSWLKQYVESSNGIYTPIRNISDDDFREIESSFYALQAAWKAWKEAKTQAVPEWISVEDKLPELKEHTWRTALPVNVMIDGYGQYLCYPCQDGNGVFYWADATYYGNDKGEHPIKCDRDTEVLNVTHWMPLPDAPQEPAND